ncbi:MAG: hypothetical protein ACLP1D_04045 [Xanthobacteraceae bacterium]
MNAAADPEIYAIRYAHHDGRTEAQNFIGGDPHQASWPLDFYLWAIKTAQRTILVDTGFDQAMAGGRRRHRIADAARRARAVVLPGGGRCR